MNGVTLDNCAKCEKKLGFKDKSKSFQIIVYINAMNRGIFPEYAGKQLCLSCQKNLLESKKIPVQIYKGNKRINELCKTPQSIAPDNNDTTLKPPEIYPPISLGDELTKAISWQQDEFPLGQLECKEFSGYDSGFKRAKVGETGSLVVTNQRLLFASKRGLYRIVYAKELGGIVSASRKVFDKYETLSILENNNQTKDFTGAGVTGKSFRGQGFLSAFSLVGVAAQGVISDKLSLSPTILIPIINSAINERKKQLR